MELQGSATSYTGENFSSGGVNYGYFDPIQALYDELGPDDPTYQFWCQACGEAPRSLWNLDELASQSQPELYTCLTPCNEFALGQEDFKFAGYAPGLCQIMWEWLFADFVFQLNGIPPGPCNNIGAC